MKRTQFEGSDFSAANGSVMGDVKGECLLGNRIISTLHCHLFYVTFNLDSM